MLTILKHPTFARLFGAQVVALIGTGLLTIALGLLAYDLAGPKAGAVLGMAYTIKMVAYVGLSPVMGALVARMPRRAVLITADLIRLAVALCLPFVETVTQVYALIFVLQAASATFTPTFQATIPDVLPDEADYTRALSLSRLAYDLENLLSPALAGLLLLFMSYNNLFLGTALGFLLSTLLIWQTRLPAQSDRTQRPFLQRVTRGSWIYLATPRLRGLLAYNTAAAAAGAFVLVNTVVVVRDTYGQGDTGLALAMGAFGTGSMMAALLLPRLLDTVPDRPVMSTAAFALSALTLMHGAIFAFIGPLSWPALLVVWLLAGALYSAVLTPSGRLLRRSAHAEDRPAVFTAHFALSHGSWLIAYPLAGWSGVTFGLSGSLLIMGALALVATLIGRLLWHAAPAEIEHEHTDLPEDHPHLQKYGGRRHSHAFVIDDEHHVWPTNG
ncbi:MFS transporter [Shimia haliotis]|uniref:Predicted arabinose efflux permease, MFS family n=1 Tax=Shimia haliotis TaxID=1280847 RepID=A0A1I4FJI2_9RHOB|nr:MFS transporter [Shimia haliotis]SFL16621.1 Predicted arabinose efflux permease, MFS family [Shimia haliotis]